MKKIISLVVTIFFTTTLLAQNSIVGSWKLIATIDTNNNKQLVSDSVVFYKEMWENVAREAKNENKEIAAADSIEINEGIGKIFGSMNSCTFLFNANKTYTSSFGEQKMTGTYSYNAATKILSKTKKGSAKPEKGKVYIQNGDLYVVNDIEKIILIFTKVKQK